MKADAFKPIKIALADSGWGQEVFAFQREVDFRFKNLGSVKTSSKRASQKLRSFQNLIGDLNPWRETPDKLHCRGYRNLARASVSSHTGSKKTDRWRGQV